MVITNWAKNYPGWESNPDHWLIGPIVSMFYDNIFQWVQNRLGAIQKLKECSLIYIYTYILICCERNGYINDSATEFKTLGVKNTGALIFSSMNP